MTPIRENVLVKPFQSEEITEGGIFVPEKCREISDKVLIVEVGSGTKAKPMHLKKGDIGYRVKGWGEEIEINGEKHYIMNQSAIIALQ
jgi:chaperonin GroES